MEPTHTEEDRRATELKPFCFAFPQSFKGKRRFQSASEMIACLQWEAGMKHLPSDICYVNSFPHDLKENRFSLECDVCGARLCFYYTGIGEFVLSRVLKKHRHYISRDPLPEPKPILSHDVVQRMEMLSMSSHRTKRQCSPESFKIEHQPNETDQQQVDNQLEPIQQSELPVQNVCKFEDIKEQKVVKTEMVAIVEPKQSNKPLNSHVEVISSQVKEWMSRYDCNCTIGDDVASSSLHHYPVLFVSSSMKRNYSLFGDLLTFNILEGYVLENGLSYTGGLFTIVDASNRTRLAAVALLPDCKTVSICWALESFCQIQGTPGTVVTPKSNTFRDVVRNFRRSHPFSTVVYDSHSVLECFRESLNMSVSEEDSRRIMQLLSECLTTRNIVIYRSNLERLLRIAGSGKLIEDLLVEKRSIFYCELQGEFVGLKRDYCHQAKHLFRTQSSQIKMVEFLQMLSKIEEATVKQRPAEEYCCQIEVEMGDARLKEVRQCYSREVVERFLENYTHGLMNFQAEARLTVRNEVVYTVSALKGSDLYTIRSSRCPCKELERTGVPCAHLLSAMMTAKVSYTELISARWMIRHPLGKSE